MANSSGGKKAKMWEAELKGVPQLLCVCPHKRRLCVIKNVGLLRGWLIVQCSDGFLVSWARLKGHATDAMEQLEELDTLSESAVVNIRRQLGEL